jgi:hypothetical protein
MLAQQSALIAFSQLLCCLLICLQELRSAVELSQTVNRMLAEQQSRLDVAEWNIMEASDFVRAGTADTLAVRSLTPAARVSHRTGRKVQLFHRQSGRCRSHSGRHCCFPSRCLYWRGLRVSCFVVINAH